jgi:hypothetical protein
MFQEESWSWTIFAQWVIQMEENMHELGVVKDHMPLWNVVVLKVQEGRDVDQR